MHVREEADFIRVLFSQRAVGLNVYNLVGGITGTDFRFGRDLAGFCQIVNFVPITNTAFIDGLNGIGPPEHVDAV